MKTPQDILDHLTYQVEPYSDDPDDVTGLLSRIEQYAALAVKYDLHDEDAKCISDELNAIIECAAQALALLS